MLQLPTQKTSSLKMVLQKKGIVEPPKVDLAFAMDVSGSFENEHRNGITNLILERLVPWGLVFDPDKKLDVVTFSHTAENAPILNEHNYHNYVEQHVIGCPNWNGGTRYSHAIDATVSCFKQELPENQTERVTITNQPSFLGKLFGKKPTTTEIAVPKNNVPMNALYKKGLVLFLTDGENEHNDKSETKKLLKKYQENHVDVYFLFLGFVRPGRQGDFQFLKEIGDEFDNTAFELIDTKNNIFTTLDDDTLNETLLKDELIQWLK